MGEKEDREKKKSNEEIGEGEGTNGGNKEEGEE